MGTALLTNPVLWSDVPDVDVLRVGDTFYMVSISFHMMPGFPIMKSTNLINWEIVNYVFDTFEDNEEHNLINGKNIYGLGAASPCLRYHNGYFYVIFNSTDMEQAYVYRTKDIENGRFEGWTLGAMFFDPSVVFLDDHTPYMINGYGEVYINRLKEDLTEVAHDERNGLLFTGPKDNLLVRCEGAHAYYINGMIYLLFTEWGCLPDGSDNIRQQVCYRSKDIYGPYERKIIFAAKMNRCCHGIASGAIFDTPSGEWFAMLTKDYGAVGRTPCVYPVTWEDGWPMIGVCGKAPVQIMVPFSGEQKTRPNTRTDWFHYSENQLSLCWQWNHNPDNANWSVTERPGYLRLRNGSICEGGILQARNTLTQRTEGPMCLCEIKVELGGLKIGDCTGLTALQQNFGMIGVRKVSEDEYRLVMCVNDGDDEEKEMESISYTSDTIYMKMRFDFRDQADLVSFFYSADGMEWNRLGDRLKLKFDLGHFTGCRMGIFCYAEEEIGGYSDIRFFRYQREITD